MTKTTAGVTAQTKRALGAAAVAGVAGLSLAPAAYADEAVMTAAAVAEVSPLDVNARQDQASSPKLTQPLRDTPQTIAVVPARVMREQNATTLRDVLRNVPGISMQAGEGGVPNGDALTVRGFSARTDILIDGVRDIGGYTRDSFNLEQVEVAKGPAGAYAGRGSTGGSINQVSKAPHLSDFGGATLGLGTDDYYRATFDLNRVLNQDLGIAARLAAVAHTNDQPRRDVVSNERWGLAPSIAYGLGSATRVTLSGFYLAQDNVPDYGIPWTPAANVPLAAFADMAAPVDLSNWYGLAWRDFEETRTAVATLKIEHDLAPGVTLTNQTRYGETNRESVATAPRFASNSTTDVRADPKTRDSVDSIVTNQTNAVLKFATGGLAHTVAAGLELTRERFANRPFEVANGVNADLYNPDPNRPASGVTAAGAHAIAHADTVAVYAFDTIELSPQWQISTGLRFDRFEVDYTSGANTFGRTDEMTSGRFAVVYKPVENASFYAGLSTAFNPSAEGLTLNADTELLEPEETTSYEAGVKWDLPNPRLSVSAAVFRTIKTNARTDGLPGEPAVVLAGEQRIDGFEAGVSGVLAPGWTVMAAYTWLDGEVTRSNDPLEQGKVTPNTPEHSMSLWSTYEIGKLTFGGGANFVGERFSSTANNRRAPSYWLVDAMAAYQVNDAVQVQLNVYNLADEEYLDNIGGGHVMPGLGRSAVVSLTYDF